MKSKNQSIALRKSTELQHARHDEKIAYHEKRRQVFRELLKEYPANSRKAYESDINAYERFCDGNGLIPYHLEVASMANVVRHYIDDILPPPDKNDVVNSRYKRSTLQRRFTSLKMALDAMEIPNPFDDPLIAGMVRQRMKKLSKKGADQAPDIGRAFIEKARRLPYSDLVELRDVCLFNLGLDTLCRVSELASLRFQDVDWERRVILVRESKTNKHGEEDLRALSNTTVSLLQKLREEYPVPHYIFQPINKSGRVTPRYVYQDYQGSGFKVKLQRQAHVNSVTSSLKRTAERLGLNGNFSGHSLRVSMAVLMRRLGIPDHKIKKAGNWKSTAMIDLYTRSLGVEESGVRDVFDLID